MQERKTTTVSKKSTQSIKPSLSVGTDTGINSVHKVRTRTASNARRRNKSGMVAVREMPMRTERKKERAPLPIGTIFVAIILTAMFSFMIVNHAEVERLTREIEDTNQYMSVLKAEQSVLEQKLAQKDDLTYMIDYAENELGMVNHKDPAASKHVQTDSVDAKSEVVHYDDREGGLGVMLSGFAEAFRDFFN